MLTRLLLRINFFNYKELLEKNNETGYPSELRSGQGRLRLRRSLGNQIHPSRIQSRYLRQVPPVLYRQAEVRRHRRAYRQVQQALWQEGRLSLTVNFPACPAKDPGTSFVEYAGFFIERG